MLTAYKVYNPFQVYIRLIILLYPYSKLYSTENKMHQICTM